ncbi:MAG: GGDEF domain-containing protein [Gemmatimonadota bacterium]|nr:GGDEF domain-containing protein [Gemmatimonadota bacterium]
MTEQRPRRSLEFVETGSWAIEADQKVAERKYRLKIDRRSFEFVNEDVEKEYRASRHRKDRKVVLFSGAAAAIINLPHLWGDFAYLEGATMVAVAGLRIAMIVTLSLIVAAILKGAKDLHNFSLVVIGSLAFMTILVTVVFGTAVNPMDEYFMYWLVIGILAMLLLPFSFKGWIVAVIVQYAGIFVCAGFFLLETNPTSVFFAAAVPLAAVVTVTFVSRRQQYEERANFANLRMAQLYSEQLEDMANTDPLTGSVNRRHFDKVMSYEWSRATRTKRPLSLLALDIDRFKNINDTYGHPVGDAVLKEMVDVLELSVREIDTIARLGGEEFAVILPDTPIGGARGVAERIREACEELTVYSNGAAVNFTVSIGAVEMSDSVENAEDFLRVADAALYEAKRGGRNRVVSG